MASSFGQRLKIAKQENTYTLHELRRDEMQTYIDRIFRGYGESHFGKEVMDRVTDEQVEDARVRAFQEASILTAQLGRKLRKGAVESIFIMYVQKHYIGGKA